MVSGISHTFSYEHINLLIPIQRSVKKLIAACWLIRQRISRYFFAEDDQSGQEIMFPFTDPVLLLPEYMEDPYLLIEDFFTGATLGEYKNDLKRWFKYALTEDLRDEDAQNLLFFHNQIIRMLHAGHLIVKDDIPYKRADHYTETAATFANWIEESIESRQVEGNYLHWEYEVNVLEEEFREDPIGYLKKELSLKTISDLRFGLQEWLYAALSNRSSIHVLESRYVVNQYEQLEKLLEVFFLLVTKSDIQ